MAELILPKGTPMEDIGLPQDRELYSWEQFEKDIEKVKPRFFDIYILGPFMIYFAVKAKSGMGRWTRRMLFTAGLYTVYRNWKSYKAIPEKITSGEFVPALEIAPQTGENQNGML